MTPVQLPEVRDGLAVDRLTLIELIEAAQAVAGVQISRQSRNRNDLGRAKQLRLRAALAPFITPPEPNSDR